MSLNDTKCRNSKAKEKPYFLGDSIGLGLYIRPSGIKSWQYRYRNPLGKQQVLTYGQYPALSLKKVRERHELYHQMTKDGLDPKFEVNKLKLQNRCNLENTFEIVARKWHEKMKSKWKPNHAKTIINRLEMDVFPQIGNIPISNITPLILINVMQQIEKRDVYEVQRRVLQYISQIFRHVLPIGLVERDLTIEIFDTLRPAQRNHYASIKPDEFPEFLNTFYGNKARCHNITQLAFEMMMFTFLRTEELIFAKWNEVDWENSRLIIPAERMKMKREHIVPLSKQALSALERLKDINGNKEYIFASFSKPRSPISKETVLNVIYRMGYKGRMTGHGFRSLATTIILEKLEYTSPIIEVQLSHTKQNVHGFAYDRAQYLDKRIKMMQDWADYIDAQHIIGIKNKQL